MKVSLKEKVRARKFQRLVIAYERKISKLPAHKKRKKLKGAIRTGIIAEAERNDPEMAALALAEARVARAAKTKELAEKRKEDQDRIDSHNSMKGILDEPEPTPEINEAQRELAQRELTRKYLIASVMRFNKEYLAGWVHKDICARLERFMRDVEEGKSPRLMLQMPPRHGKSTLVSIEFPAWVLGHHPDWEIITCSYAETLALDFSRAVRERLRDKEYKVVFPRTVIDPLNQNAKGWKTSRKGGFLPAGVEGPITGKGAHILIIDDPVKNAMEAESETTRENAVRWYSTTAYSRLAPGGGVLIVQTRWHLDDLSGRLEHDMLEGKGDKFEIVRYPARATEDERWRNKGDPLHPERYNLNQLKMIERAVGPMTWAALYQQNPVPAEGAAFSHDMIQYYRKADVPEVLTKVAAWDLAIGQKEANDRTVGMTWGMDIVGQFWIVDCRVGHFDAMDIVSEICDSYEKHKPYTVGIEKDKVSQAVGPYLDTEIGDRGLYGLHVTELSPAREGNKLHRCRSLQGLMRRGKVFLPHPDEAPWVYEFVSELMQFPYGRNDDFVDAAAWLGLMASEVPAPGLAYSKIKQRVSWKDRLKTLGLGQRSMMSS